MNERIREIALLAGIKISPMIVDGEEYDYEEVDMDGFDDLQKFAELIVRECALVVFKGTGPRSALNVLEHFDLKDEE